MENQLFPAPAQGFETIRLDSYGPEAVFSVNGFAVMVGLPVLEVEQAIAKGELPKPFTLLGRMVWTQGQLVDHIEGRAIKQRLPETHDPDQGRLTRLSGPVK